MKITIRILLALIIIFLIVLNFSQFRVSTLQDITIQPLNKNVNPDFDTNAYTPRPPVYLISYADGREIFFKNQNTLVASALNRGVDIFINYRRSMIDQDFYEKNRLILEQKPGAGYWLWKPYVLLKTMQNAPENAKIIYADSGFAIARPLTPYLKALDEHDIVLIRYPKETEGVVKDITFTETLDKVGCTSQQCHNQYTVHAAFVCVRNTPQARAFIKEWLEYCTDQELLIGKKGTPKDQNFHMHRHDQTLLSALAATDRHNVYYYHPYEKHIKEIRWHHRKDPKANYYTLIPELYRDSIRGIERQYMRVQWAQNLKAWILEQEQKRSFQK